MEPPCKARQLPKAQRIKKKFNDCNYFKLRSVEVLCYTEMDNQNTDCTNTRRSTAINWCKVIKHSRSQGKKLEEEILAVAYGYRGEKENKNGENPEK